MYFIKVSSPDLKVLDNIEYARSQRKFQKISHAKSNSHYYVKREILERVIYTKLLASLHYI